MASFSSTLATTYITPNILPERVVYGYSQRYVIPYSQMLVASSAATADSVTITLGATPTNWLVGSAMAEVVTAFGVSATQTLVMSVGTSSNTTAFLASTSVTTAGAIIPANGASTVNLPASSTGTSALNMVAVFTNGVSGNLSSSFITAGMVVIELSLADPTQTP